jgi:taurine--2-oxoglutarate transaminase
VVTIYNVRILDDGFSAGEREMSKVEQKIKDLTRHTYGTWRRQELWKQPLLIEDAEGAYMYDADGKRYMDFSSQLMCSNLGHKNKPVVEAIVKQAEKLPYIAPGFTTQAAVEAVNALRSVMPENLECFFFSTSGTEANEAALKMVRQFKAPNYKILSRYRSYHGATAASLTFTGDPRRILAERARCTIDGVRFAPDAYCYRCPFHLKHPDCGIQCARYVDYMIREEGNVAGIIVEPVVGTNGRIVPPPEYFPLLREICDENDVLLIVDEVMSGWYRTGKAFAIEHWNVRPDILTMAKGCTAAYTPAGVTVTTRAIADFFEEENFNHGHTYAYHPLVLSAIPAAVAEYDKLMKSGHPQRVSEHLRNRLYELGENHPCVGDVRGMGHFWALELVKNRETKEPFNVKTDKFSRKVLVTNTVAADAMDQGLYVLAWYDTMIIAPPLIITEAEVDDAIKILDKSLTIADEETVTTDVPLSKSSEFVII